MSEQKIEPALSAEAWASVQRGDGLPYGLGSSILDELSILEGRDIPAAIAWLNNDLPDDDPRKITHEKVRRLREGAYNVPDGYSPNIWLANLAEALASYLPPETA